MKNRKLQILKETVEYYSEDTRRRCIKDGRCKYSGETIGIESDGCAVGRLIEPEARRDLDKKYPAGARIIELVSSNEPLIPKNVKELGGDFLEGLQYLHDSEYCWEEGKGLSITGELVYDRIKNRIELGEI